MKNTLVGTVTGFDGRYYIIVCPEAPGYLKTHYFTRSQMGSGDARVGDTVTLEYFSNPSRGYWFVKSVRMPGA